MIAPAVTVFAKRHAVGLSPECPDFIVEFGMFSTSNDVNRVTVFADFFQLGVCPGTNGPVDPGGKIPSKHTSVTVD